MDHAPYFMYGTVEMTNGLAQVSSAYQNYVGFNTGDVGFNTGETWASPDDQTKLVDFIRIETVQRIKCGSLHIGPIKLFFVKSTQELHLDGRSNKRGEFPVKSAGTAKQTFIEKEYSFVFILKILRTAVVKYFKVKCQKIITAQYPIHHCTFSIHHSTMWSSLRFELTLVHSGESEPESW